MRCQCWLVCVLAASLLAASAHPRIRVHNTIWNADKVTDHPLPVHNLYGWKASRWVQSCDGIYNVGSRSLTSVRAEVDQAMWPEIQPWKICSKDSLRDVWNTSTEQAVFKWFARQAINWGKGNWDASTLVMAHHVTNGVNIRTRRMTLKIFRWISGIMKRSSRWSQYSQ